MYKLAITITVVIWALIVPFATLGAEWFVNPGVGTTIRYRDATDAVSGRVGSGWRLALSPSLQFGHRTPRWQTTGSVRFDTEKFSSASEELGTSNALQLNSSYDTELSNWSLGSAITRDTILASFAEETGVTTGDNISRRYRFVGPSYSRSLAPRWQLNISARVSDTSYSNAENSTLSDFANHALSSTLSYQWSEKTELTGSVSLSTFNPDNRFRAESDSLIGQVGINHAFSETLSASIAAGPRKTWSRRTTLVPVGLVFGNLFFTTDTIESDVESEDVGGTFSGTISKKFATGSLSGAAVRNIFPSGIDGLVVSDRLSGSANRNWGPFWTTTLNISWNLSNSTDSGVSTRDRETFGIQPGLRWKIKHDLEAAANLFYTEQTVKTSTANTTNESMRFRPSLRWKVDNHLALSLSYDYQTRKFGTSNERDHIHSVFFRMDYQWDRISVSR